MKQKMKKAVAMITATAMLFSGSLFSGDMLVLSYAQEAEDAAAAENAELPAAPAVQAEAPAPAAEKAAEEPTAAAPEKAESPAEEPAAEAENAPAEENEAVSEETALPETTEQTAISLMGEEGNGGEESAEEAVNTPGHTFGANLIVSWLEEHGYEAAGDRILKGEDIIAEFEGTTFTIRGGELTMKTEGTFNGSVRVEGDTHLTLAGAMIEAANSAAITIAAGVNAIMTLEEGTENAMTGANGYAGIGVGWETGNAAGLTIEGTGSLEATGKGGGAGIGGSNNNDGGNSGVFGNITINSGVITATGIGDGAGIGTSSNPKGGTSSGSYKNVEEQWGTVTINGGDITARSTGNGAGIGSGNHTDSGKIIINGGSIDTAGYTGIGCGIGSSKTGANNTKGPGYYFADVEINGGTIKAAGSDIGAGIGGGMYSDAIIKITGGTIEAIGGSRQGNSHHGGAGIGGGYLGHSRIEITGGIIDATGGDGAAGIGSGGSPNATAGRGTGGRAGEITVEYTDIAISGGSITARGGVQGGAGIGGGVGADKVNIAITGGNILAMGAASTAEMMRGGAGIGSGFQGTGSGSAKYFTDTETGIEITGGSVTAIGGWGASGIGSGAANLMANTIRIGEGADIEAYADGTKFAIDTRILNEDGITESRTEGRDITTPILQGTYVRKGVIGDSEQNPEGLKSIQITNDKTGETRELTLMPEGYRSFAASVSEEGNYTVYTDEASIGEGEGRYFSRTLKEEYNEDEVLERNVQYRVTKDGLADNNYLYPVKTIVVSKVVEALEGTDLSGLNQTLRFALKQRSEEGDKAEEFFRREDGSIWVETIEIRDGVPRQKAYFINVEDRVYDVWEVVEDEEGNLQGLEAGGEYGDYILRAITTRHGEDSDNNAEISDTRWSDEIIVVNTYEVIPEEVPEEPAAPSDITPEEDPEEADEPAEDPADGPAAPSGSKEKADEPAEDPTDKPADEPAAEPTDEPADEPAAEPADEPAAEPTPAPVDRTEDRAAEIPAIITPAMIEARPAPQVPAIPAAEQAVKADSISYETVIDNDPPQAVSAPVELADENVPLAGNEHDHDCCLLHLILMAGVMATIALYSRRRKALGKDLDAVKAELLALAAETGLVEKIAREKNPEKDMIDADALLKEAMKDEYMVR